MSDLRFRYIIDVQPPATLDLQTWHDKFIAAIIMAVREMDGALYLELDNTIRVQVKEVKERKAN